MKMIDSPKAPKAQGPYSHVIQRGGFLFLSGQIPVHPATMRVENGGLKGQTPRVLENIEIVLNEEALKLSDVVKVNVYLADMVLFPEMNVIYEEVFQWQKPARTTFNVKGLPLDVLVEIDCIGEYNDIQKLNA